jgi:hypothetical protein
MRKPGDKKSYCLGEIAPGSADSWFSFSAARVPASFWVVFSSGRSFEGHRDWAIVVVAELRCLLYFSFPLFFSVAFFFFFVPLTNFSSLHVAMATRAAPNIPDPFLFAAPRRRRSAGRPDPLKRCAFSKAQSESPRLDRLSRCPLLSRCALFSQ